MTAPLRVLHVHSGNLYGGVETLLLTLARHQDAVPNLEQSFALCFDGLLRERLDQEGYSPLALGPVRASRPWTAVRARRTLRSLIVGNDPAIVVCHAPWALAVFGPAVRDVDRPLVYWQHGITNRDTWVERWAAFTRPDLTIANSQFTADSVPNLFPGKKCEVIHCPVEPHPTTGKGRNQIRRDIGTGPDTVVIVQVSRMEPWKGQRLHLHALGELRGQPDWECWQVGGAQRPEEERYLADLQALAGSLGIADRIRFLGQRSDVPDLLGAADIFCQPNVGPEPFGITFVEALYAGLPVVATAMGGVLEIVDESCGVLSPAEDVPSLAATLRELIEDPKLRARLAHAAPLRAKEISDPYKRLLQLHNVLGETLEGRNK